MEENETITSISEAVRIVETFIQDMADDKLDTGDKEKLAEAEKLFAKLEHAMRIIKNRV
tara:strand:- start:715 stop:891 length:177 start_codon:yes stop_codon:yes gene_type:complete